jgi:hypothetical protein
VNGVNATTKPLCKVIFKPNDNWNFGDAVDFLTVEIDTHNMWNLTSSWLTIPAAGIYSVIMNVNYATSGIESEWGVMVQDSSTAFPTWNNSPTILRVYTGYGAYHGQYGETLVNLRQNDRVAPALLASGRSTAIFNSTNSGLRASHLIVQYISPGVPARGANGTAYDFR